MGMFKRLLKIVLLLVVVLAAFVGVQGYLIFGRSVPLVDGAVLKDGSVVVQDGYVASFLVPIGDQHVVAIDCGQDPTAAKIKQVLADKKWTLDAIFVTHAHPDHIGGCNALGAPVAAAAAERDLLLGVQQFQGPVPKRMSPTHLDVKTARVVGDGEVVQLGMTNIRVFLTPGHTPGSASYQHDGVLFLGDNAVAHAGEPSTIHSSPWVFSDDVDQSLASVRALARRLIDEADPKTRVVQLAFAHSGPVDGGGAVLAGITK